MFHYEGQYGKADDYTKVGIATWKCGATGWIGQGNVSACAVKYTLTPTKTEEYFEETEITDDNVEEYTDTINQVMEFPLTKLLANF